MKKSLIRASIAAFSIIAISATASAASFKPSAPSIQNSVVDVHYKSSKRHHSHYGHKSERRVLSERAIKKRLRRQGYRKIHRISYRNGRYYARAMGRYGPVKLKISARSGHVIWRKSLRPQRHYYKSYRHGHNNGFSWSFSLGH